MRTYQNNLSQPSQRGTALVMSLVFLVLLTLLGITAINTSTLEERMAGNTKDQNLSFQAAETALRVAEVWVEGTTAIAGLTGVEVSTPPTAPTTNKWDTVAWTDADSKQIADPASGSYGVTSRPRYIVEIVKQDPPSASGSVLVTVRITARGTGLSNNTVSMVQSTYGKTYPP